MAGTPTAAGTFSFTVKVTDASSQTATKAASITIAGGLLAITAPASTALPSTSPGGTTSARLGEVTVTDNRGIAGASWTATVTGTMFVTGGGTAPETIPLIQITYWSGPATAITGTGTFTPGQASAATAVNLTVPRTAFSLTSGTSVTSASWNPTLSVSTPATAVAGTYTATITHSSNLTARRSTDEPVSVPVCSIRGSNDGLVTAEQAQEWRKATSSEFSFIELPGDHMYLVDRAQKVLA